VGQFLYPDENRIKKFQSGSGRCFTHFTGIAGFASVVASQFEKPSEKRSEKPVDCRFYWQFFPAFLFMKAETQINSSLAGMLNSLTPVFTLLVGLLFHKTEIRWMQIAGLTLGLLGAAGLILAGEGFHLGTVNSYAFYIVLATFFYAISINQIKAKLGHLSGIQVTSVSFLFIGPVALVYLLTTDLAPVAASPGWPIHLLALATLAIVGTAMAMLLMNTLIRHSTAVAASSVTYIIPVFAILWGVLDDEKITLLHLICMGLILAGVYLISLKKKN